MKWKPLLILGTAVSLFVILFLFSKFPQKPIHFPISPSTEQAFEAEEVERIQIGYGHPQTDRTVAPLLFTILKAKQEDRYRWRIPDLGNARADEEKIGRLLNHLQKITTWIQSSPAEPFVFDNRTDFLRISLYSGTWDPLLELAIGTETDSQGRTWIRESGSEKVHWIDADLIEGMGIPNVLLRDVPTMELWLSLQPLEIKVDHIQALEIATRVDGQTEVLRKKSVRQGNAEGMVSEEWKTATHLISELTGLRATKAFPKRIGDYGFDSPRMEVKIWLDGGEEITFRVGHNDPVSKDYFCEIASESVIFQVPKHLLKDLLAPIQALPTPAVS